MNHQKRIAILCIGAIILSSGSTYLSSNAAISTHNSNNTASWTNVKTEQSSSALSESPNQILATRVSTDYKFTNLTINAYVQHPCYLKDNYFATAKSIQILNLRDTVLTEGQSKNGFSKVKISNREGFIETSNLTYNADSIFALVSPYVLYSKNGASLYSKYTNSSNEQTVIANLPSNEEVIVIADNCRNWFEVKYKGQYGFIPKDNLMASKNLLNGNDSTVGGSTFYVNASAQKYNLQSDSDIDMFTAVVMAEAGGSYDSALAAASAILNRCDKGTYFGGHDVLYMMGRNNTGTYWSESYHSGAYQQYLNNKYSKDCRQAVMDAINGKRNHHFRDFAAPSLYWSKDAAQWPDHWECDGNIYCDGTK